MRSDGAAPISSHPFDMYLSDADQGTVFLECIYDSNWVGTPASGDVATAAFLGRQIVGDAYFRTVEIDMLNLNTSSMTQPHLGIELSAESGVAGDGSRMSVGIAIHNYGDLFGVPTPKAIDTGLFLGGDNRRMTNFIRAMGNTEDDANGSTVLFNVNYQGVVTAGNVLPRGDSTYTLGNVSFNYLSSWVDTYVGTAGIGTTLHFSLGATGTGFALTAADSIGFMSAGSEYIRMTTAGLLDFRASQLVSVGTTTLITLGKTGGSGPANAAQAAWLKILNSGSPHYIPTWQ